MNARRILAMLACVAVLALLGFVLIPRLRSPEQPTAPAYWPTRGWRTSTPEEQGIDSAKLADALLTIREKNLDIHSLLVIRNGSVAVDAYFYPYGGSTVHDLASVTKSLMTTLIGIASDQGRIRLDQPIVSFFSERPIANRDARKERITVRHLASMSSGLDCTQERDEATLKEMQASADWVQFTLNRPVAWEPGTHFVYCSPGMHLLSAILQQATGMTALEFARQNLFAPLGIHEVIWPADPQGVTRGWGDVKLYARDAAKLGYLWLNKGVWEGRQIVSGRWVEDSVTPQMTTGDGDDHGVGWWIPRQSDVGGEYRALGRGGQAIVVFPVLRAVVVTTGGGFNPGEATDLLGPALVDPHRPLPANPAGVAHLAAALSTIAHAPAPVAVAALPQTARVISGRTFFFERNPVEIEALRFDFDGSAQATAHVTLADGRHSWPVGLDGVYRMSMGDYNLPLGLRGHWADADTFILEYEGIASNDHVKIRMRFEGNRVRVEAQETAHELGARFEGRLQTP